jgi:hypothetical protein
LITTFHQVKRRRRLKKHLAKTASTGKVVTKAELSNLWVMAAADDGSADELSDNEEDEATKDAKQKEAVLRREEVREWMHGIGGKSTDFGSSHL